MATNTGQQKVNTSTPVGKSTGRRRARAFHVIREEWPATWGALLSTYYNANTLGAVDDLGHSPATVLLGGLCWIECFCDRNYGYKGMTRPAVDRALAAEINYLHMRGYPRPRTDGKPQNLPAYIRLALSRFVQSRQEQLFAWGLGKVI